MESHNNNCPSPIYWELVLPNEILNVVVPWTRQVLYKILILLAKISRVNQS